MEEDKAGGLLGRMDKLIALNEQIINKEKEKKWKTPFKARVGNGQAKKGYTGVIYLTTNGRVKFLKRKIENHVVKIDNYHSVTPKEVLQDDKGRPLIVAAEWDDEVLCIDQKVEDAVKKERTTFGQQVIFAQMKRDLIKPKGEFSAKWLIIGFVVLGIIYWLFKSGRLGG